MLLSDENRLALLKGFPERLGKRIIGQGHVLEPVCRIVRRGEVGTTDPRRPKGSFLFVGPTGVGKTELTIALSDELGLPLYRMDMSEFQTSEATRELLGFDGEEARFSVARRELGDGGILLLDEIEKAHGRVLDLLLQILDAGRVTVAGGQVVRFNTDYVVLTSNIGAREAMNARRQNITMFTKAILQRVQQEMRPELYNRIGCRVVFRALEVEEQIQIAELVVRAVCLRIKDKGATVSVTAEALRFIKERGIDRYLGARPLREVAEDLVEHAVALARIEGREVNGVLSWAEGETELHYSDVK